MGEACWMAIFVANTVNDLVSLFGLTYGKDLYWFLATLVVAEASGMAELAPFPSERHRKWQCLGTLAI